MKAKVQLSCKWYRNWDAPWLGQKSLNLYFSLYGWGREVVPSKWILSIRFALFIQPKGVYDITYLFPEPITFCPWSE